MTIIMKHQSINSIKFIAAGLLLLTICFTQIAVGETIDDKVRNISYLLMCPVCQGQSVGESNSNLAQDMRGIIRGQLEEGKSEEEILEYFVNRYGDSILASPPVKGINWLLWLLPAVGIVVSTLLIGLFLHNSRRKEDNNQPSGITNKEQGDSEYLKKIDEELDKLDS